LVAEDHRGGDDMGLSETLHAGVDRVLDAPPLKRMRMRRYDRWFAEGKPFLAHRGVYASFEEAAASAPATQPVGYDNEVAPVVHSERAELVWPSDYPVMLWLTRLFGDGCSSVFDLGGNVGVSYHSFKRFVSYPSSLRWLVCDVPATIARAKELARRETCRDLGFTTAIGDAAGYDILLGCGVVQYLPRPLQDYLAAIPGRPRHLLVNSVALHPERSFFTLQNIQGDVFVPYRIPRYDDFVAGIEALGYTTVDRWDVHEKKCSIPFAPQHSIDRFRGFYFRLES
jgi:putative methyltransferase (TIGR04325 family)